MSARACGVRLVRIVPLILVGALVFGSPAVPVAAQPATPEAPVFEPLTPPSVTAQAVFVEDATAGTALYAENPDERRSMASTTKLMTALLIARNTIDWQELVTADASDVLSPEDGESMIGLLEGDMLTVEQMMYGIMLNSGNDAAHAMARFIGEKLLAREGGTGDPVERFVQEMNNTAAGMGLRNTHFTNPSGLYSPDHYTSARDLAAIAAAAYAIPEVAGPSSAKTYEFTSQGANPRVFTLENTNKMLGEDGVAAGKTGTLMESGACLVILRHQDDNMIIGVVLGSAIEFDENEVQIEDTDQRFKDMHAVLTQMDQDYRWVRPGDADFPGLTEELAVWNVGLGDDSAIVLPAASAQSLRYLLQLGPPVQQDAAAGSLLIFDGDRVVAARPVVQL